MNTKLTLSLEQQIIERAKKYARKSGRSLSNIVENYLKVLIEEKDDAEIQIAPLSKSLRGAFTAPASFDYKRQLSDKLSDKYL